MNVVVIDKFKVLIEENKKCGNKTNDITLQIFQIDNESLNA